MSRYVTRYTYHVRAATGKVGTRKTWARCPHTCHKSTAHADRCRHAMQQERPELLWTITAVRENVEVGQG